jgi:peptidyl-prolyl cis-trans isomerase B (cyclophilin B)
MARKPAEGDITAIMKTNKGDIKIILFPEASPKAVENFITHAENGYYDGVVFHRVIDGFMIQGGDPTATGRGGESIWGRPFKDEFHPDYHNIRGALSMANAGPDTNGSQFFIVQAKDVDPRLISQMKMYPDSYPPETVDDYENLGGTPHLDYKHAVFGWVYDGMDVVDTIASSDTDNRDKPLEDVVILSVEINK